MSSYEVAARALVEGKLPEGSVLVHGTALTLDGNRIRRAWVVLPDWSVWEPMTDHYYPKGEWEKTHESRVERKYKRAMVVRKVNDTGTYGPWGWRVKRAVA